MSFYGKWILPRLLDIAMRNKEATRYRSRIVPQARGALLEIGVGSGLNLPIYGEERLNPPWSRIAGGCHLNRKMDQLIRAAGIEITELETEYAKGSRPISYVYSGQARPITSAS